MINISAAPALAPPSRRGRLPILFPNRKKPMTAMKPRTLLVATAVALASLLGMWFLSIALQGCSPADVPKECSDAALTELEGKFATELLLTCSDYRSVAECPGAPGVIAKYDGLRKEWTECR